MHVCTADRMHRFCSEPLACCTRRQTNAPSQCRGTHTLALQIACMVGTGLLTYRLKRFTCWRSRHCCCTRRLFSAHRVFTHMFRAGFTTGAFHLLAVAPALLRAAVVLGAAGLHGAGVAARAPPRDRLLRRPEHVLQQTARQYSMRLVDGFIWKHSCLMTQSLESESSIWLAQQMQGVLDMTAPGLVAAAGPAAGRRWCCRCCRGGRWRRRRR